jgi:hypothetical protein
LNLRGASRARGVIIAGVRELRGTCIVVWVGIEVVVKGSCGIEVFGTVVPVGEGGIMTVGIGGVVSRDAEVIRVGIKLGSGEVFDN